MQVEERKSSHYNLLMKFTNKTEQNKKEREKGIDLCLESNNKLDK